MCVRRVHFFAVLTKTTTRNDHVLRFSGEREPQRLILYFPFFFFDIQPCPGFTFAIVLTVMNKKNDFSVSPDSQVKDKFPFQSTLSSASPSWFPKQLPNNIFGIRTIYLSQHQFRFLGLLVTEHLVGLQGRFFPALVHFRPIQGSPFTDDVLDTVADKKNSAYLATKNFTCTEKFI